MLTPDRLRTLERFALAGSVVLGLGAGFWVLASRALSDFLGEGPVRVLGLEDGAQQALIGWATLALVAAAAAVTSARMPLWRYAAGGLPMLACVALAPPLFTPIVALYAAAFATGLASRTPRARLKALAPRRHPAAWTGAGLVALAAAS